LEEIGLQRETVSVKNGFKKNPFWARAGNRKGNRSTWNIGDNNDF
jgi:hypothetical protein